MLSSRQSPCARQSPHRPRRASFRKSALPEAADFGALRTSRILARRLHEYRHHCRTLLQRYRALLRRYRALLWMCITSPRCSHTYRCHGRYHWYHVMRDGVCCTVLQLLCVLQCVAVCCSVLQCVLQRAAVCCSSCREHCGNHCSCMMLRDVAGALRLMARWANGRVYCVARGDAAFQCVVVCCSALQCVAVCCRVVECVAACCSVVECVAACCRGCCVASAVLQR